MRILIDCDVLLDVALQREPHFEHSAWLLDWAERHPGAAAVAWHTLANLEYLAVGGARNFIEDLIRFASVPETGTESMRFALDLGMKDLEDAMQVAAAERFGAQAIATRNVRDYAKSPIRAMSPVDLLPLVPR